jgi:MFS family permease
VLPTRDRIASATGAALFSCSLGIASVALPLLALRAGYSAAEVGVLTAASAIAQMATRGVLGVVMRRVGDWVLVVGAAVTLALSCGLAALSPELVPFTLAQLLQGVARACFWTGSQTHVVRGDRRAAGALASINFVSSLGLLVGPVLAGVLVESSAGTGLAVGAVVAAVAAAPALLLDRLPPFSPPAERPPGRLWRRPGVDVGCWAGASAGAWRGLLSSFVPVALDAAGQSASTIGVLVSVANGAAMVGALVVGKVHGPWVRRAFLLGTLTAGGGTAVVALAAGQAWLAAVLLAVSGLGAGALQTVGPAIATEAVHPEERGEAIAAAGTFRAAALFGGPIVVSGAVAVLPLAVAMAAAGVLIAAGSAAGRRLVPATEPT